MTVAEARERLHAYAEEAQRTCPLSAFTIKEELFFTGQRTDSEGMPISYASFDEDPQGINSLFFSLRYTAEGVSEEQTPVLGIYLTVRDGQVDEQEWEEEQQELAPQLSAFYAELAAAPDLSAYLADRQARSEAEIARQVARRQAQMQHTVRLMIGCGIAAVILIVVMLVLKARFG